MQITLFRILSIVILLSVFLLPQQKELTLESIFTNRDFRGSGLSGVNWIPRENKFSWLKYDPETASYNIMQHEVKTGEESVLVSGNSLKLKDNNEPLRIQNYQFSSDGRYILFTGVLRARKVKSGGTFYLYDRETKDFFIAAESEEEQVNAALSPDGSKLGFVRGNNLFSVDLKSGKETQLTSDGNENILNGLFDWVYEEEFSIIKGWEWSPDSKSIAYWRLDQSNVPDLYIARWDSLYMQPEIMKYPKPGAQNSHVQIGVVEVSSANTVWMDIGDEKDIYIPRMSFTKDPGIIAIQRLNRLQNKIELLFADTKTGKSEVIITDSSAAWVEVIDELRFLNNKKEFIWSSERDGNKHLYLYGMDGKLKRQLTTGNWEVILLIGVDEDYEKIFFTANERGVLYSDLYSVNLDGTGLQRLTSEAGTHSIIMSPDNQHYIDNFSTANSLTTTNLNDPGGTIRTLVKPDMSFIDNYNFVPVEFITFTTSDGAVLNASVMKPADFNPSQKYPVLFDVYGGPGSQSVIDIWGGFSYLFKQFLVKNGYIVFNLDNRGTGGRGTAFRNIVYKNLGKWEVNDMVEGAKFLISQGYADPDRIGISGSSYGGYTAAITLMNGGDYFSAAVAELGVMDWRYYDNIYTERFMQTPDLNPEGYKQSSVLTHAEKMKGSLLILHGTADDNVHFQNSVKLAERLINLNKHFEIMFYPESRHGVHGKAIRHYYETIFYFLERNLKGGAAKYMNTK